MAKVTLLFRDYEYNFEDIVVRKWRRLSISFVLYFEDTRQIFTNINGYE